MREGKQPIPPFGLYIAASVAALFGAIIVGTAASTHAEDISDQLVKAEHAVTKILGIDADVAYGEYLAGECVTCHRSDRSPGGIPPIVGLPVDHAVPALVEYRMKIRDNEVMRLVTSRLSDEEIAALAAYFATLGTK